MSQRMTMEEVLKEYGVPLIKLDVHATRSELLKLREQLIELVSDGSYHIVVDLEKVDFLDSTGLGVLVGGLKRVRNHDGSLQLVCTQEKIVKIFERRNMFRNSGFLRGVGRGLFLRGFSSAEPSF